MEDTPELPAAPADGAGPGVIRFASAADARQMIALLAEISQRLLALERDVEVLKGKTAQKSERLIHTIN